MDASTPRTRLHLDLYPGCRRLSPRPFHGFFQVHPAPAFPTIAVAILQHLELCDQPQTVDPKGMSGLVPVQFVHELNRPPPLETEQPLDPPRECRGHAAPPGSREVTATSR